jgi:hypothetical protein
VNKALIILSILFNLACGFGAAAVDRINITDYGATPNDGRDDTAAINSAVAAGTSIYFPPGSYNYTGQITVPAHKSYRFYGEGPGVSTILFTGPSAGIYAPTVGARTARTPAIVVASGWSRTGKSRKTAENTTGMSVPPEKPCTMRHAISDAGRAMEMVYGRGGPRGGGSRAARAVNETATARHSELNAIGLNH